MLQKTKDACLAGNNNPNYQLLTLLGCTLVDYEKQVMVSDTLQEDLIAWYHQNLGHSASDRQNKTMRPILYWPGMSSAIERFIRTCVACMEANSNMAYYRLVCYNQPNPLMWYMWTSLARTNMENTV